jgi:recombination protein RecT
MSNQNAFALILAEAEEQFMQIAASDGNIVNYEKEFNFALQAIEKSEHLQRCKPSSFRSALVNVASVGLSLNPALKLAYPVPRDGLCCLDISYMGLVKIATDTGSVNAVKAEIVRSNDDFEYMGPFERPHHKFDPFAPEAKRGEVRGVYTLAKLANGETLVETLSMEEINKIRAKSKAKSGPWFDWFDEMAKKSAIKRAYKLWPSKERLGRAVAVLNEHEGLVELEGPSGTGAGAGAPDKMPVNELEEFKKRITATTTTDAAKAVYHEAVVVCTKLNDIESRGVLKEVLKAHGAKLDAAKKQEGVTA